MKRAYVSLRTKLSASIVAVTLLGASIAGALIDRTVADRTRSAFEDRLAYEATMLGQMTANALFGDLDPNDTSLNAPVRALGEAVHTQLTVLAKDGTVVADSGTGDPRALGPQAEAAEIVAARKNGEGRSIRDGRLFVARAIVRDGMTLGFARSSVPIGEVSAYVLAVRKQIGWGSAMAVMVAIGFGLLMSSRLVRPIRALSVGARRVGAGNFEHPIEIGTHDEIGELAASFNEMTANLRQTIAALDGRNRDMRLVLDHVDQGLLTLDRDSVVSKEHSAVLDTWFGDIPAGSRFAEIVARFDSHAAANFTLQWGELVGEALPEELLLDQLPKALTKGEQRFELSYLPLREGSARAFSKVLVVLSDVTPRLAAERAAADQREAAAVLEWITRDKHSVLEFLLDSGAQVKALTGAWRPPLVETKHRLHTLKGNAAVYGMQSLVALCHEIETRMAESQGDIEEAKRDELASAWARLATRLSSFLGDGQRSTIVVDDDEHASVLRALLEGVPRAEVARMVRHWKMERVSDRLQRFAESARQLAVRLNKGAIEVDVPRTTLRLPREEWAPFWQSFHHVVRNAVDHGSPSVAEGLESSNGSLPRIRLSASRQGSHVVIEIEDNGRGIDWEKIAERARGAGLAASSREDLAVALFVNGISSKDEANDVSGRGMGLGAVKEACERLGGRVHVHSDPGRGTMFRFRIPLADHALPSVREPAEQRPVAGTPACSPEPSAGRPSSSLIVSVPEVDVLVRKRAGV